ncbi:MAG: DUF748 domain-containing protein [Verrucomicrobiota bacterium]
MFQPSLQHYPVKRRKALRRAIYAILLYAVMGFLVLPPIIRWVAARQLGALLDRPVKIRSVRLNPFALSATVRGLEIQDKDGQPFVSWEEVYVNLQLSSFLGHPWVFSEVRIDRPFARAQMNRDYSFNFSDLVTKFSTNTAPAAPTPPAKALALEVQRFKIIGAQASMTDLTQKRPFTRVLGPLDLNLDRFRTAPNNRNPYAFTGTTDAGEKISWNGHFYVDPLKSEGTLELINLALNKYSPLYEDFLRFQVRDGVVSLRTSYEFEWSASNHVAAITNTAFRLAGLRLGVEGSDADTVVVPEFSVSGVSADAMAHRAMIESVRLSDAAVKVQRDAAAEVNLVEMSKPAADAGQAPAVFLLLRSLTNAVALLRQSTNAWVAGIQDITVTNCAVSLEDHANSRPVSLMVDQIAFNARNLSNLPSTNIVSSWSLRWNTNGTLGGRLEAALFPTRIRAWLQLNDVELHPLGPYLEPWVNILVRDSKLGLDAEIAMRTVPGALPEVTFRGDTWLNDLSVADGSAGEDLLAWKSVRTSGIEAGLNPMAVNIREISIDGLDARLAIRTNRSINLVEALRLPPPVADESSTNTPTAAAAPAPAAAPTNAAPFPALPRIAIADVVLTNNRIQFQDSSISPPVRLSIDRLGGRVSGLSSETANHAVIDLSARVDNVGPVEITGTINPFSGDETNEVKVSVHDVDLTAASPYAGKFAGYRIAKGKLNLDLAYHIKGRSLKSENLVMLDQFTFGERVDSPDATHLPVRLAIAILKDRNGRIEIDMPVEGSLDDPSFRVRKVILHTLMNLLTRAATSPFSLLGSLFGGQGEDVRFQDFDPGSAVLLAGATNKLDAIVHGLYERPGLQLEIQGSVDPVADRDGLQRVLLERRMQSDKWKSLRKSVQASTEVEQVVILPEERAGYLKDYYAELLKSPRAAATSTNTVVRKSSAPPARTTAVERGVTSLQRFVGSAPVAAAAAPGAPAAAAPADPIEAAVLAATVVTDADYEALATERARAVRDYLVQPGRVAAERVFLSETQSGGVKREGARAYLQLR